MGIWDNLFKKNASNLSEEDSSNQTSSIETYEERLKKREQERVRNEDEMSRQALEEYYASLSKKCGMDETMSISVVQNSGANKFFFCDRQLFSKDDNHIITSDELKKYQNQNKALLITGDAGCGKSTLLSALAMYDVIESKDTIIPFYIPLKSLKKEMEKGMDTLEEYLSGFSFLNCEKDFFYQIVENRKIHLYFDAVDELPAEQREDVLSVVSKFIYEYKENIEKIIISSRNETDINPSNLNMKYDCYELRIFTEEEYELFLKTNMTAEEKAGFTTKIEDFHEEIKNNPYYLTGLITAYKNGKELPINVYAIMDYMLEELLAREKEKSIESKITNKIRNKLPRLAFEMLCTGAPLSKIYRNISAEEDDVDEELEDMTNRTIISGRTGDFASQKMQEFLAAEYIIKSRKTDILIKSLEELPEKWDNVFLYWISEWELQPDSCEENNVYIDALISNSQIRDIVLNNIKFLTVKRDALYQRMSDCLVEELLSEDTTNVYATDFFFFVPKYRLYAYVADTISRMKPENPTTKTALYLLRDICFMYAAVDSVDDIPNITAECRDRLKATCNQLRNEQNGQRHWLTRMFYNYEELCDEDIEIIKGWVPVYPREFCVRHAYSRRNEEYLDREDANSYEDEEGLFQVCGFDQDEYKGLCALNYDVKAIKTALSEKKHNRLSGIILIQSSLEDLKNIFFTNRENIYYYSMPDNIQKIFSYAFNFMKNVNYIFIPQKVQDTNRDAFATLKTLYLYIENDPNYFDLEYVFDGKEIPKTVTDKLDNLIHGEQGEYGKRMSNICVGLADVEVLQMRGNKMYYIPQFTFRKTRNLKKVTFGNSVLVIARDSSDGKIEMIAPAGHMVNGHKHKDSSQFSLKELVHRVMASQKENTFVSKEEIEEIENTLLKHWADFSKISKNDMDIVPPNLRTKISFADKSLPNSITCIDDAVFKGCSNLVLTKLPEQLETIGKWAFAGCKNIKLEELPRGLKEIGASTFQDCENLRLTKLPERLESIGEKAFCGCKNIKLEELPRGLKEIGASAFQGCENLRLIKLPEQLETIGSYTFSGCKNIKLEKLPRGLKEIGASAFSGCENLRLTKLPEQLETIGNYTFCGCKNIKLEELPSGIKEVGVFAFASCENLALTKLPEQLETIGRGAFAGCQNIKLTELPNSLKEIGDVAFCYCQGLELTELPKNLERIGKEAFSMCNSIVHIKLPSNVKQWGAGVFCECVHLLSVEMGETMESVPHGMFQMCEKLNEVIFSQSLKTIRKDAFLGCVALDIDKLPEPLGVIEDDAFRNCCNVKTLYFPDTLFRIGNNSFNGCTGLYRISIPYDMARIEEGAFANCAEHIKVEIRCNNMDEYHEIMKNLFNDDSVEKIFGESTTPEFVPSLLN